METLIYDKLDEKSVKCRICRHFCVIRDGKKGLCQVRENRGGKLLSLVYSKVVATSVDPIEKKPIFHLKPGSSSYSIATMGCNFNCAFCQNADIAQLPEGSGSRIQGRDLTPEWIVKQALETGCESISYTYTEPTVFFELALATARLAKEQGLFNVFVTNGYMSPQVLERVSPYLDAANVDLKAFSDTFYKKWCRARLEPVKDTIQILKGMGVLVELTTLLIPGLNDDTNEINAMAAYIANDLGKETPWHVSRFHPCHNMTDRPPTSVAALEKAYEAGKKAGLRYVYTGNVPGLPSENTYCHFCSELLVRRHAYQVTRYLKETGKCPKCGTLAYGRYA